MTLGGPCCRRSCSNYLRQLAGSETRDHRAHRWDGPASFGSLAIRLDHIANAPKDNAADSIPDCRSSPTYTARISNIPGPDLAEISSKILRELHDAEVLYGEFGAQAIWTRDALLNELVIPPLNRKVLRFDCYYEHAPVSVSKTLPTTLSYSQWRWKKGCRANVVAFLSRLALSRQILFSRTMRRVRSVIFSSGVLPCRSVQGRGAVFSCLLQLPGRDGWETLDQAGLELRTCLVLAAGMNLVKEFFRTTGAILKRCPGLLPQVLKLTRVSATRIIRAGIVHWRYLAFRAIATIQNVRVLDGIDTYGRSSRFPLEQNGIIEDPGQSGTILPCGFIFVSSFRVLVGFAFGLTS